MSFAIILFVLFHIAQSITFLMLGFFVLLLMLAITGLLVRNLSGAE